jgi:6-phosphogluconolactonase
MATRVADLFVRRAEAAIAARGRFVIALSGCAISLIFYARLASERFHGRIPWSHVHIFWTDEVCAPADAQDTRYQRIDDALLSRVGVPRKNVHAAVFTGDYNRAAIEYEQTLRAFFELEDADLPRFDLVCLELGSDGHAASLFPGSSALDESTRVVTATYVPQLREHRITLTAPVISNAATVVLLVGGESHVAVSEALGGAYPSQRLPSQLIRPRAGSLYYFLEERAGAGQQSTGT